MPIIGLNLGKSGFKAVELEKKKDVISILHFGTCFNPELDLYSDKKEDIKMYSRTLESFIEEHGFLTRDVVLSIEEAYVYMRVVDLPPMQDKELKNAVQFEAQQYIPLPLEEVTLTHQKVNNGVINKDKMRVQLVAAKQTILDRYVAAVKGAHLVTKAIEPETIALGRVLGDTSTSPSGTIILDIGATGTLAIVVHAGVVQFTRNVSIGGDVITRTIEQNLNLDRSQAEEYKKVYGMDPQVAEGKVCDVIKPLIDTILTEVKRASVFFTNQMPSASIKRIIITGGSALMPGLMLHVANNLDLEVQIANPLRTIEISPTLEKDKKQLNEQLPVLSAAIGLAMREL